MTHYILPVALQLMHSFKNFSPLSLDELFTIGMTDIWKARAVIYKLEWLTGISAEREARSYGLIAEDQVLREMYATWMSISFQMIK